MKSVISFVHKIRKNMMGTISFNMKMPNMRKEQDFIVYPISESGDKDKIHIQSDTRFGVLDLRDGKGEMSSSQPNGSNSMSLMFDQVRHKTTFFEISLDDLNELKGKIKGTADPNAGSNGIVFCDNSGAANV